MILDNIQQLTREHEQLVLAAERAKGRRLAVLAALKDKYGVETVEQIDALLKKLTRRARLEAEADHAAKQEYLNLLEQNREALTAFLEGDE